MRKTRVLIVEDEFITADHIADILSEVGYEPLQPALNYNEALERLDLDPDIAILDINLGSSKSGIDLARHIRGNFSIPFIFLSSYVDDQTLKEAKSTFPKGFLTKPYKASDFKAAIEMALVAEDDIETPRTKRGNMSMLSPMEQKIVIAIAHNKTSKTIAYELDISLSTVKNHRHNICRKLDLPTENNALLNWALRNF